MYLCRSVKSQAGVGGAGCGAGCGGRQSGNSTRAPTMEEAARTPGHDHSKRHVPGDDIVSVHTCARGCVHACVPASLPACLSMYMYLDVQLTGHLTDVSNIAVTKTSAT